MFKGMNVPTLLLVAGAFVVLGQVSVVQNKERKPEVSGDTQLIYPPLDQVFPSQKGQADVTLVGQALDNHTLEVQLVREGEEFDDLSTEVVSGDRIEKRLSPGHYRWRMRTQLANLEPSAWTKAARFSIRPSNLSLPVINNLPQQVGLYHQEQLQDFFAEANLPDGSWLEVSDLHSQKIFVVSGRAWPAKLTEPGVTQYSYRLRKQGYFSSPWSKPKVLQLYLPPPENLIVKIPDDISPDADNKVSVNLVWDNLFSNAKNEIQISRDKEFRKKTSLYTSLSNKYLGVRTNTDYFIRSRAVDKNRKVLSAFSKVIQLNVPFVRKEPTLNLALVSKIAPEVSSEVNSEVNPESSRKPAATSESSTREKIEKDKVNETDSRVWAWVGTGINFINYEQVVNQRADFDFSSNEFANYYLNLGWLSSQWGVDASYKFTPGKVNDSQNFAENKDFEWTTLTLDGLYVLSWVPVIGGSPVMTYLRGGVQRHTLPQLYLTSGDELSLVENDLLSGGLGMGGELAHGNWQYSAYMRYQHPISSRVAAASSFSLNPKLAFDGSLGVSYAFAQRFSMGVFWYGHWINYDYEYVDNSSTQTGFQSLFFSNLDLRLGLQF